MLRSLIGRRLLRGCLTGQLERIRAGLVQSPLEARGFVARLLIANPWLFTTLRALEAFGVFCFVALPLKAVFWFIELQLDMRRSLFSSYYRVELDELRTRRA